jgi:arylsulfatase A-like enzyme/tetratricopeptide (TPR) repeat protein
MLFLLHLSCTTTQAPSPPPSVVLITLDTTRQDRIGAYGYQKSKTETIDSFAEHGYRFDKAYSTIPLTTPAHASMLTGMYPPHHGVRNNGDAILPEELITLTEHLQQQGYDTVASISAFVTTRIWNLDQGFNTYFDTIERKEGNRWAQERNAGAVVDDLVGWLEQRQENQTPFFMWAHFYDPHHPHIAEEGYTEGYEDIYDAEIAYVDDQIKRLQDKIKESNTQGVVWVVVADHGEAFDQEHGESSHGMFLYDETVKVPLIIQPHPKLNSTSVIQQPVSIVDIPNTVLSLLQLPMLQETDGINALQNSDREYVYIESSVVQHRFGYHPELALVTETQKYMPTPNPHLYNLQLDPDEKNNQYKPSEELSQWKDFSYHLYQSSPLFNTDSPDASVLKHLEALGYMGGDYNTEDLQSYSIDAKDRLKTIHELEDIVKGRSTENFSPEEVISRFKIIIEQEPQVTEARLMLSQTLNFLGRKDESITVLEEAYRLRPTSVAIAQNLANQYAEKGEYNKGIDLLNGILERVPGDNGARTNVLKMMSDSGQNKEAIARGKQWLQETPTPVLQAIVGVILVRNHQFELGKELLIASLSDSTPREHVYRSLGHVALSQNDIANAIQYYEMELKQYPDIELQRVLAELYSRTKDWNKSQKLYCQLSEQLPKATKIHLNCAQTLFNLEQYEQADIILQRALNLQPNGPYILLLAANIEGKIGDPQKAQLLFDKAKKAKQQWDAQIKDKNVQVPKQ